MTARMGISVRREWVEPLLVTHPSLPALEVIFEQWLFASDSALEQLERLGDRYPLLLHCLSMNIGSCDPLDRHYFEQVRAFADRFEVAGISDHLSWRSMGGNWSLSLLPLPRTEETLGHLVDRLDEVQVFLGRTIALENVSQYLPVPGDIPPAEMFNEIHQRCGTAIHLDLNNLLVCERWLGESPAAFLDALTAEIAWVHVAGQEDVPLPVDDHSRRPSAACMKLLDDAAPAAPVILEWDRHRPSLQELLPVIAPKEAERVANALV
ncbi:MAG: DUF692 family multinuclear iron-containing protein [Polyangiales bacterium]